MDNRRVQCNQCDDKEFGEIELLDTVPRLNYQRKLLHLRTCIRYHYGFLPTAAAAAAATATAATAAAATATATATTKKESGMEQQHKFQRVASDRKY